MKKFLPGIYKAFIVLYVFLLSIPCFISAHDIRQINFAEEANWPPFTPNKLGKADKGLSYDLMNLIFSKLDVDVNIELYPMARVLDQIKKGNKDGITIISKNQERLQFLDYTDPVFRKVGYLYYLKSRPEPVKWTSYEDLKGLKIGIVRGNNYGDEFKDAVKEYGLKVQEVNQNKNNFDKLLAGRIDIIFSINMTAAEFLKQPKYRGKITFADKPYYSKGYHIAFSKKSNAKSLIPEVNKIIAQVKASGELQKVLDKYSH